VREAFPATERVTFDLEDVPLILFLHHLMTAWRPEDKTCPTCKWPGGRIPQGFEHWPESYQPPAAVQRLAYVVHAGVQGFPGEDINDPRTARVTVKVSDMPWNELFENVLASNGLGFVLEKDLLFIARVEDLGAFERIRGRAYGGPTISLNFLCGQLPVVFGLFRDVTDLWIVPDPNLVGSVTLVIAERPAMQVLDLVLVANDLVATPVEARDAKPGTTALRIRRRIDAKGDVIDLTTLMR
jgi:hypothetical protein